MHLRKIRIALVVVAMMAGAALLTTPWSHGAGTAAGAIDPHADVPIPKAEMHRLLAATEAATQATSQTELAAEGRALFRSNDVAKTGESCNSCHTEGGANAAVGTIGHPRPTTPNDFTGPR